MELIGSLFLVLALAVIVAIFIGQPLLLKRSQKIVGDLPPVEQARAQQVSTLLAERDRVLNALQELDFDYALGKVPPEDYPEQRSVLLKTGAEVLRQLDEMNIGEAGAAGGSADTTEDRIEAVVAARRADAAQRKTPQRKDLEPVLQAEAVRTNGNGKGKDELEEIIALRKRERKESAAGFCPHCGKPVQKSDKFCSKCGATL